MLVQGGVFTLRAKTAWAHDWNTDRAATATFQALPGATFTTNGAQPSANAVLLSLGGEMNWHNGWTVAANFGGEFPHHHRLRRQRQRPLFVVRYSNPVMSVIGTEVDLKTMSAFLPLLVQ